MLIWLGVPSLLLLCAASGVYFYLTADARVGCAGAPRFPEFERAVKVAKMLDEARKRAAAEKSPSTQAELKRAEEEFAKRVAEAKKEAERRKTQPKANSESATSSSSGPFSSCRG
jgi:Skp family chaperone for outer membrane proteins